MIKEQDIILDQVQDLEIIAGDFSLGESLVQEVGILLQLEQGNLKEDPLLGANMTELIKSKTSETSFERRLKIQFERDNKNYEDLKQIFSINGRKI